MLVKITEKLYINPSLVIRVTALNNGRSRITSIVHSSGGSLSQSGSVDADVSVETVARLVNEGVGK